MRNRINRSCAVGVYAKAKASRMIAEAKRKLAAKAEEKALNYSEENRNKT